MRHSKGKTKSWYPFWTDKWLWGSTRHELIVEDEDGKLFDLRGIYVDLLTLSKKDDGFIRANESTPYPHEQLAGMFCVPLERLKQCIEICLHPEVEKLREPLPGIYYIPSTADYELSEDYIRRISPKNDNKSEKADQCTEKAEPIIEYNRKEKNRIYKEAQPNSLEDVKNYFVEMGSNQLEGEKFNNHFSSNGWKVGGRAPMKDWKAAARNWMMNSKDYKPPQKEKVFRCNQCGESYSCSWDTHVKTVHNKDLTTKDLAPDIQKEVGQLTDKLRMK